MALTGATNEERIRALPKQPPEQYKHKFDGTATYVKNAKAKTKH